ncbi:hypothetical protein JB92DRAFT_2707976, partial [Gautieria morchelliformis]
GADVDAMGGTYGSTIIATASGGHSKVIQFLLEAGADINVVGHYRPVAPSFL